MKIELIDYTGKCSSDDLYAAKLLIFVKNTRLEQNSASFKELDKLLPSEIYKQTKENSDTIRSSWEFVDFTFSIQDVTRAATHQLVRTRTASYAQQSHRAVDMTKFKALKPESVKENKNASFDWDNCIDEIETAYSQMKHEGIPSEDCRGLLPTNVLTNIIMKLNLRTLADLVPKRNSLRVQGEQTAIVNGMAKVVSEVMPWTYLFLYPDRNRTPELDAILKEALGGRPHTENPKVSAALKELEKLKGVWG